MKHLATTAPENLASAHPPKVSVLLPIFNGAHFLEECLDSILGQDFSDMEILASDDGSTDDSRKIIERYAALDARIRHWKNARTLGLTANSNACLRAARGEYIKYIHQDDKLLSCSAVRKMAAALDRNPSAVLVASRQHVTGARCHPIVFAHHDVLRNGRRVILSSLERNTNLVGQPTLTMFRKSCAQRGFDERFTGQMDFEMWCYLLEQGDFVFLSEALATWRVHPFQQTARAFRNGGTDMEHLQLLETYYAKPWLRQSASAQLLFSQIYHLRKRYGNTADEWTGRLLADLSPRRYWLLWVKHKAFNPLRKLFRKLENLPLAIKPFFLNFISHAEFGPRRPGKKPEKTPEWSLQD